MVQNKIRLVLTDNNPEISVLLRTRVYTLISLPVALHQLFFLVKLKNVIT